jgi:hypothetical protein
MLNGARSNKSTGLPVLDDFGQDVSVDVDEGRLATRTLHHDVDLLRIVG